MELRHNYPAVTTNHSPVPRTNLLLGAGLRSWNNRGYVRSGLEVSWQSSPGQACSVAAHIPTCLAQARAMSPAIMSVFDNKKEPLHHLLCVNIGGRMGITLFPSKLGTFCSMQKFPVGVDTTAHAATSPFLAAGCTVCVGGGQSGHPCWGPILTKHQNQ